LNGPFRQAFAALVTGPRQTPKAEQVSGIPLREIPLESADQQPECREFREYWLAKKPGSGTPERRFFDPLLEVPQLAPHVFILDFVDDKSNLRVRLMGTQVGRMYGADVTGRLLSDIWLADEFAECLRLCRKCVETVAPVAAEGSYHWQDRGFLEWKCVMAPMRSGATDQVLGFLAQTGIVKNS
jgi:hypothetical protein